MGCFCLANLDLLPSLNAEGQVSLSASAQAAIALHQQISLGMPNLPGPLSVLPSSPSPPDGAVNAVASLPISALATITALAQLQAQAVTSLGIDLTTDAGIAALAQLTATLDARMSQIASLNLNLEAWIRLAQVNAVAHDLTAIFNECLNGSGGGAAFNIVVAPPSW